jgi:hypothetical protein
VAASYNRDLVRQALALLGIKRFAIRIANASFPSLAQEDIGCGSPYSQGGRAFVRFIHELGFDTLVLAPQGQTRPTQPSPYLASCFSRSLLSLAALPLCSPRVGLLSSQHIQRLVSGAPVSQGGASRNRVDFPYGWNGVHGFLEGAFAALQQNNGLHRESFRAFVDSSLTHGSWLQRDALFYALAQTHGTEDWQRWPRQDQNLFSEDTDKPESQLRRVHTVVAGYNRLIEAYSFGQFLLQEQHEALYAETKALGLSLFAETIDSDEASDAPDRWAYGSRLPAYELRERHLLSGFDGLVRGGLAACRQWNPVTRTDMPLADQLFVPFELLFQQPNDDDSLNQTPMPHWALRVPADYARSHAVAAPPGAHFDLRRSLAHALASHSPTPTALALAQQLEADANA